MVDIKLHSSFKERMAHLSPRDKKILLETLRKLSESPYLEPDRRVTTENGEVCQIVISDYCELIYRVESVEPARVVTPGHRTPVAIYAVLQTPISDHPVA
jgi:mRNA-degrading endonuclease RelE of RelBE toxin-antitoxin system